ncbi:hypothetical protein GUITHDRAFT_152465 [Guillardia theta CCMP2712]|uniref:Uncharacterized protein n=1 Tax=Guillardia theta (strain CCMP2712) TaxID=905079 RepID=L1JDG3_GUITC|nr:hypothetical protein GUITHDRAFT_154329 [Guillardia theta CCMP2712]XP_005833297.1 hypothetical protein GUITHDRAFT_152465 [Guillardia theta CCMP2712]EKX39890.1 hypothetical protein GUITHDRAFT_154329 [Guillardia theta CCMP2712]EKX46317.1 hypothetical protein GUITHDRAFT_152465 [Guillardia theta CCMP2712]|eukprot:XP_005826870.1 hypothetical protein GUITHDRAFT_154329 [Guillardia theta CCMP2712]
MSIVINHGMIIHITGRIKFRKQIWKVFQLLIIPALFYPKGLANQRNKEFSARSHVMLNLFKDPAPEIQIFDSMKRRRKVCNIGHNFLAVI